MGPRLAVPDLIARRRVGRLLLSWSLGLAVAMATVTAVAAPLKPRDPQAREHFDRAVQLYTDGDYDAAAEQAERGAAIEEHESLLFIWAQAERQRHRCVEAVELFSRFIEQTESEDMHANAVTAQAMCAEELAELAKQAAEQAEEDVEPAPEVVPPAPASADAGPSAWTRDPIGLGLVGAGGAAVLSGGAVLIAAAVLHPERAHDYEQFADRFDRRPKLLLGGGVTLGVGLALSVAGAVRLVLLAQKQRRTAALHLSPWVDRRASPRARRETTGLVLRGRF